VVQSYILTTAKYDCSIYEKRILYRLVEALQFFVKGKKLQGKIHIEENLFREHEVKMPISLFLAGENDNNYGQVKKALRSLEGKSFEYEDEQIWQLIRIIQNPEIEKYKSLVSFRLHPKVFDALLDFSKGFRKYELKTAMMFKSVYSMRFYELLSGQKNPITYTIEDLKIMFKVEDKYKLTVNFIRKTIDVAKKELDEKSPYSFEYRTNKIGKKIHSVTLHPIYIPKNRDDEIEEMSLRKQVDLRWDLDKIVINYLKENFEFTEREIKNNFDLFKEAHQKIDLLYFLSEIKVTARNAKTSPQAFVIGALRKKLGIRVRLKKKEQESKNVQTPPQTTLISALSRKKTRK